MIQTAVLLALSAIIVAASVGCALGTGRLAARMRPDCSFLGEILVTFACVLPEYLIALHSLLVPSGLMNLTGDPFIPVGAIMGAAAANMLLIGALNSAWPERAGLDPPGRPLASAALILLVACAAIVGLGFGRGKGVSWAQILAGAAVFAIFLTGLRLVGRQVPGPKPPKFDIDADFDPLSSPARGTPIGAIAMTAASVIVLVYASPLFVGLAVPWFRSGGDLPREVQALLLSGLTIALGLLLAVPDLILSVRDMAKNGGESPTPRLFLSSAALIAFTVIAGLNPGELGDRFPGDLFASFALTVFVTALTVILLLAVPSGISPRMRGMIVAGVASGGLVFAVLMTGR